MKHQRLTDEEIEENYSDAYGICNRLVENQVDVLGRLQKIRTFDPANGEATMEEVIEKAREEHISLFRMFIEGVAWERERVYKELKKKFPCYVPTRGDTRVWEHDGVTGCACDVTKKLNVFERPAPETSRQAEMEIPPHDNS